MCELVQACTHERTHLYTRESSQASRTPSARTLARSHTCAQTHARAARTWDQSCWRRCSHLFSSCCICRVSVARSSCAHKMLFTRARTHTCVLLVVIAKSLFSRNWNADTPTHTGDSDRGGGDGEVDRGGRWKVRWRLALSRCKLWWLNYILCVKRGTA